MGAKCAPQLAGNIATRMRSKGYSQTSFCRKAGINLGSFNQFLKGHTSDISLSTLEKIAGTLETTLGHLLSGIY
ncbi:MAG: helix-turn-helix transcriptional regulator [Planctomycetes bacterium]|nr:helix-turn-helix transcriptional regulator [Planctomycetota bacterium]